MTNLRFLNQVPRVLFGQNQFDNLEQIIESKRHDGYIVFMIDEVHNKTGLKDRIPAKDDDLIFDVDTSTEPKTCLVNTYRDEILSIKKGILPELVVGIGGGSTLDIAKAVSVMLTNSGISEEYQGWNLVKKPAVPKLGIPTLSGTGAEASRTAVLTSKDKKYGINSDYSMFDIILLDPLLLKSVPNDQRFYTGMDCYIHSVESIQGSFINEFGKAFSSNAMDICRNVFLKQTGTDSELMVASYLGGVSVMYSEVGVAHALSYGISLELGYRHGIANCIVFNQLDEFYPDHVPEFRVMMKQNQISLPVGVTEGLSKESMDRMIEMTYRMERPLTSALGENWRDILTPQKIQDLYERM